MTIANLAEGWRAERLNPPSRLYGANGLRTGADGRIYVAQVAGSQVSAVDPDSGAIQTISPIGGDIHGPDDLAFDDAGNLYCTEVTMDRVSVRQPNGAVEILQGDIPVANPITFHQGRLIVGERRFGARIMELDRGGGAPRLILGDVPLVNAFEVGPDGKLYFPVIGKNEIWRVGLDGGEPEVVTGGLAIPNSVKFAPDGFIVSTQTATGQVLRIDPRTGDKTVHAQIRPGLDNCTFVGERLFISSISGQITEILAGGAQRELLPDGLQWPMGLAVAEDGTLFIADGGFSYTRRPGGLRELAGMHFTPGYPGFVRGAAASGPGEWVVTTANGELARFRPTLGEKEVLASGYYRLMGLAIAPGGTIVFAEGGTGRVLALGEAGIEVLAEWLDSPAGVAIGADGTCYVSDSGAGQVVRLSGGRTEIVLDDLAQPEGIALCGGRLYVVEVATQRLTEYDPDSGKRRTVATRLPVGAPDGAVRRQLGGFGNPMAPMTSFTGVAADAHGNIYVSADAEGSILAFRQDRQRGS